jgi:hypothetical protein
MSKQSGEDQRTWRRNDTIWLLIVFAMALGWRNDYISSATRIQQLEAEIATLKGTGVPTRVTVTKENSPTPAR